MTEKIVYIILLNWNGCRDTMECIASCRRLTYNKYRLLIVDNGSIDGSEDAIRLACPDVEFLQNGKNLGFAGGNNRGIEYALAQGADYIWLLNNDTIVAPMALKELVAVFADNDKAGIVGSKIYYYDDPDRVWFAGGRINYRQGTTGHIGEYTKDEGQYGEVREVDYITGCSLMISREAIAAVGLMDERYFLLFEETDWNERVKKHGYTVLLAPKSHIWHKISRSLGERSALYNYYLFRNCLLFTAKHKPLLLPGVCLRKLRAVMTLYRQEDKTVARFAIKGIIDFFRMQFNKCGHIQSGPGN